MTCLCFFTKASSLGGLGICIKLLFTSESWTILSRNLKEKKTSHKRLHKTFIPRPQFLNPNSLIVQQMPSHFLEDACEHQYDICLGFFTQALSFSVSVPRLAQSSSSALEACKF